MIKESLHSVERGWRRIKEQDPQMAVLLKVMGALTIFSGGALLSSNSNNKNVNYVPQPAADLRSDGFSAARCEIESPTGAPNDLVVIFNANTGRFARADHTESPFCFEPGGFATVSSEAPTMIELKGLTLPYMQPRTEQQD